MKKPLKSACDKEEAAQLGDMSRRFDRHADRKKVVIANSGYFSALDTDILSYRTNH